MVNSFFSGCFHHPGCCISNDQIPEWKEKAARWERKKKFLEERGQLVTMRECHWKHQLPSVRHVETVMGRILNEDCEQSLIRAIEDNKVWGFAVCDVSTPNAVIKDMTGNGYLFHRLYSEWKLMSHLCRTT